MFYILNIYSLKIGNLYRLQGVKEFVLSYKIKIEKLTYTNSLKGREITILKECILLTFISSRHDTNSTTYIPYTGADINVDDTTASSRLWGPKTGETIRQGCCWWHIAAGGASLTRLDKFFTLATWGVCVCDASLPPPPPSTVSFQLM